MIRQPTDISIYFPTHQLTPSHIRIPFFKNFFFPLINLPPHTVYYQKIQKFYFSVLTSQCFVFCLLSSRQYLHPSPSLCKLDKILSFTVSPKSRGYLIPVQKAGFNTKHEHSVIFSLSQA